MTKGWNYARSFLMSISGFCCLLICFCIAAQIFCRFFLGISLKWSEEIAQVGIIFMVFLALSEVEVGNEHLQVEILHTVFPKLSFAMTLIGKALNLIYVGIVLYSSILMLPAVQRTLAKASKFPIKFLYYGMIAGSLFWIFQISINLYKAFEERRAKT